MHSLALTALLASALSAGPVRYFETLNVNDLPADVELPPVDPLDAAQNWLDAVNTGERDYVLRFNLPRYKAVLTKNRMIVTRMMAEWVRRDCQVDRTNKPKATDGEMVAVNFKCFGRKDFRPAPKNEAGSADSLFLYRVQVKTPDGKSHDTWFTGLQG
jgi:hypothetical protein